MKKEIFEPGDRCAYTAYKFVEGEQGMKCLSCSRVMTLEAWEEKKHCFCGSTNVVQAMAAHRPVFNEKPIETPSPVPNGNTPSPVPNGKPRETPKLQKWQILLMSAIGSFLVFVAIALLSQ